jgi:hypothetical protein
MPTKLYSGNMDERDLLGNLSVDGRIILKQISKEIGCEVVDWMQLRMYRVK